MFQSPTHASSGPRWHHSKRLSMDAVSPSSMELPKRAEETLRRIPATERRTRGPHEIALFRNLSPSVVRVVTNEGSGSGSIISGGLILTNWHVVGDNKVVGVIFKPSTPGAQQPSVNPANPTNVIVATVVRIDQVRDLALLRPFSFPTDTRNPIEFADPKDIAIGADAYAIGHLCVPKTLSTLMRWQNRLSWRNDWVAVFIPCSRDRAMQVEEPA